MLQAPMTCAYVSLSKGETQVDPRLVWVLGEQLNLANRGNKKLREWYPEPGVVFGCRTVLLKLCFCGRSVCFDVLLVDNNLESMKGAQSITISAPVQSLKYSSSWLADLSCGFANADFAIFFGGVLQFGRFHCRVFGFAVSRHQNSCSTCLSCMFFHLRTFNGTTVVALVVSVHIICLQSSTLSCRDHVCRFL